jgi:hypothetical protein
MKICVPSNSRWVVSLINTRGYRRWMADDGQRVPGDILGRVAQEVVIAQLRPEVLDVGTSVPPRTISNAALCVRRICSRGLAGFPGRGSSALGFGIADAGWRQEFHKLGLVALMSATVSTQR